MSDVIEELGRDVPMKPRRGWKVYLMPVQEDDQVPGELFSSMVDAELIERIAALEAEVERLRGALAVYANEANWMYASFIDPEMNSTDGGHIARAALEPAPTEEKPE